MTLGRLGYSFRITGKGRIDRTRQGEARRRIEERDSV